MASFDEVLKDCTKLGTKIPTSEYLENGKYPIIDQGQNDIAGYYDSDDGLFEDVPTIVFGDHTRVVKYVDKPCFLGADGVKLLCPLDKDINCKYLFYQLSCADIPNTGYNRHFKWVKALNFKIPSSDEQNHVVEVLDKVTELISLRKQQLAKLDELVKARFVEMFGESEYPCNSLISLIIEGAGLSYGIVQPGDDGTGDMGVLRPVDFADGKIKTDSIKYIDRSLGDGFKKTELNGNELLITVRGTTGITALTDSRFKGMNVTRGIAVIRYDKKKVDPIYLNEYIKMEKSQQYIKEHTRGATLQQINLSELRDLEIVIPPLPLQRVFATFVEHVDQQKQTVQQSLEKLELLKKALMQEYFG